MLIRFHVSNFLSFREEVEFSMVPGRSQQHKNQIVYGEGRYDIDVLKAAVLYGANAAGKSNLVKAMSFAKDMIIKGSRPAQSIARIPFKLDRECLNRPSKFEFEFKYKNHAYIYGFEVDSSYVHNEWLYEIKPTTEKSLFERTTLHDGTTKVVFGYLSTKRKKDLDFLNYVAMGTRPNQLFLTESIERNVKQFREPHEWFASVLTIIFPSSFYYALEFKIFKGADLASFLVNDLETLGTGVCGFALDEINPEAEFPAELLSDIRENLKEDVYVSVKNEFGQRYIVTQEAGEIKAQKLMLKHRMSDCDDDVLFEMREESDGTLRLLDLLPLLHTTEKEEGDGEEGVYIIDELDRSLHPSLSYEFMRLFLSNSSVRSQIIVTTHETGLLSFDLLRRDEIWFVEKDINGATQLYSLEEFTPRYDKDIRKGYLLGRFGAIPMLDKTDIFVAKDRDNGA